MRYPPGHKEAIRERILRMATLRFRAEGLSNVGIANLMADLGLTHGGFYAHFDSKEALIGQACLYAMRETEAHWRELLASSPAGQGRAQLARSYLSPEHRDFPDSGCVAAALAGELSRLERQARQPFEQGLRGWLAALDGAAPAGKLPAGAALSMMVGALLLSRAVCDPALSEQLLAEAREALA